MVLSEQIGPEVGYDDGAIVGEHEGKDVGSELDGAALIVGGEEGSTDGTKLGFVDGFSIDGLLVGSFVGSEVGSAVGSSVEIPSCKSRRLLISMNASGTK